MAASLVKSLSTRFCINAQRTPLITLPLRSLVLSPLSQSTHLRKLSSLVTCKDLQQPLLQTKTESPQCLKKSGIHTTAVCKTTKELKQWREGRVIDRFYRLNWGGWIRPRGGRYRQLYMKTSKQQWRLKQHIFCNRHQHKLLDTLVTAKWKEPKYFVDTGYEPYQKRTNCYYYPNHKKFYP